MKKWGGMIVSISRRESVRRVAGAGARHEPQAWACGKKSNIYCVRAAKLQARARGEEEEG